MTQEYLGVDEGLSESHQALLAGWRPVLDSLTDGAVMLRPDGRVVYLTPRAEQLLEISLSEILGMTIREFPVSVTTRDGRLLPDDAFPAPYIAQTGHSITDFELRFSRRNGSQLLLTINAAPVLDADGALAFICVTLLDRTLSQQATRNLHENERLIANIYASIQDGISILDHDLTVLSVNPAMERWNTPRLPLIGKKCYTAYHGRSEPCENCPSLRTLRTGNASQAISALRDEHGLVTGWVDLFTFPLVNDITGEITGVIEYVRNISERMQAEEQLQEARANEQLFIHRLRALHEVRNLLFKAATIDELFRQAVDLAHSRLDIERISVWLLDPQEPGFVVGTYGIDEQGHLRDERGQRLWMSPESMMGRMYAQGERACVMETDSVLYDHLAQEIGRGIHLLAPIWDAQEIIGFLSVDNALTQQPPREEFCELLELYASALGHRYIRLTTEATLRQSEEKYRLITEHASDMIWTADLEGRYTFASPSALRMKGYTADEYLHLTFANTLTPEYYSLARRILMEELTLDADNPDHNRSRVLEAEERCKDGSTMWTESTVSFLRDGQGHPTGILGVTRDISARKQAESHLNFLAYYDALTGLPNRLLLLDRLGRVLTRMNREQILVAVMLMDLDNFKTINDNYAHSAGDELLVQVARRLNGCVRESDTVARLSGDEFVLMLPLIGSHENALMTAQRVLAAFTTPFPIAGHSLNITTSLGICFAPDDAATSELLLHYADLAMYAAKAQGRNACVVYTPELSAKADLMKTRRS